MDLRSATLVKLLSQDLPMDRVGPHLRDAVKRAIHTGDTQRLMLIGRVVVAELLRRGDLLRTAVEGAENQNSAFFLIRNTTNLVDLSIFGETAAPMPSPIAPAKPLEVPKLPGPKGNISLEGPTLSDYAGMLGAMEQAQDLELGNFHSGESCAILSGILRLLGRFTPQFRLFIMYYTPDQIPDTVKGIISQPQSGEGANWLSLRTRGHSAWLPVAAELPVDILNGMSRDNGIVPEDDAQTPFSPSCAVAVPLWEPQWDSVTTEHPNEAGLLFLVAKENWGRDPLLRLATRFSSFVTSRWQHQKEVNQRINKDGLTGVYNRAFFDNQFTLELERARRSESPLTLVIADLDHFKQINDSMGHQVGDLVLIMVARRLQEELRRIDHICRIGGEEFALILPDTSHEAALDVMNRLLKAPFTEEVVQNDQLKEIGVTFSFGVVSYPDSGKDAFELYRKADAMLYLSKDQGRNQCHFWSSEGDHVQLTQ
jgi:diguanylate cyclase (GGDEF)-like protein